MNGQTLQAKSQATSLMQGDSINYLALIISVLPVMTVRSNQTLS